MKYWIGLVGLAGVLEGGCEGEIPPVCYPDESYEVTEDEEPELFAKALAFEAEIRINPLYDPDAEAGRVSVVDIRSLDVQDEDSCGTLPGADASVLVELEVEDDFSVVVPALISMPEDGEPTISIGGTVPYDSSMRFSYTAPEQWRISGVRAVSRECGSKVDIEAMITPDVCEDVEGCEHNEFQSIMALETDSPGCLSA